MPVIAALDNGDAAIPALPVTDTLKRAEGDTITATVPRENLYRAQTPQAFAFDKILAAHETATSGMTDDAAIAEAAGLKVTLIDGDAKNIKLTHEEDFMSHILMPRTGAGFDVHRFDEAGSATEIMLGGIAIPHTRALIGHSDADVALHAITDALLGALVEGDIGDHFPPSDDTNKDRPSADFLAHAVSLAGEHQARISHIDLTLICETPKIGPHRDTMRARIAAICGIEASRVSVKATTTEGLGFTGRGEGLAAQALVTVLMPEVL
jgi:2-C-methyl-D-erythritol 4-phosphate cytidylyltransferase/2-C-methyl-D-erythritol 2,4-cyclodiphosphate synthase